ncbi:MULTISPECIES: hypothetical protein [unclassified Campylobacter]|uniref:hypothetical protein n=1 Tax=unclassified Campylobacter TaxID=2593542 RepID=UPI0022E9B84A|nr:MULTISPECIES: hypothetical protein [unclassified Campylobacter]MDA3054319.1 hypothetical protein [Campylobacter sp. VBCF_07 NA4]MDA3061011.1 hypothetical protein [Campylobacter sp. VBCF_02 NA5]MDA3070525.1 hypothetical protein [Campylobacter sp. VBCF_08 NA3]WBR53828.1 hypothetical protein PF027_05750 [Campylobacter sp. VBCF_01 NA2]
MKKILFLFIFTLTLSSANQAFDYEYSKFKAWYQNKSAYEIGKYIFERAENGLFNKLKLKDKFSYNYGYKGNKFYFKLKVDDKKKFSTAEFRNAVERLICQEPLLSAAIYTELKMEFSIYNPYIDFTHYKFGLNKNTEPLCIEHRQNIKQVDKYWQ